MLCLAIIVVIFNILQECTDVDMPVFDMREPFDTPVSDKENYYLNIFDKRDDIMHDFSNWGNMYRAAVPEPAIPHSRRFGKCTV